MSRPSIGSAARDQVITFRCTKAEKELIEAAAEEAGVSPGKFAYAQTMSRARMLQQAVVRDGEVIVATGWCAPASLTYDLQPPQDTSYEDD